MAFPAIWWLFPLASTALILLSLHLTRPGRIESRPLRSFFLAFGAFLGLLAFALPFFPQPHFPSPVVRYAIGLPLALGGLLGRVYPMTYLRRRGTTTVMDEVRRLVDTGPYAWVRHPQYTFGFISLCGWFLVWGAVYSLFLLPFIAGIIYIQALIEEKHILEEGFGREYAEYRKRVGMLIPRVVRSGRPTPDQD